MDSFTFVGYLESWFAFSPVMSNLFVTDLTSLPYMCQLLSSLTIYHPLTTPLHQHITQLIDLFATSDIFTTYQASQHISCINQFFFYLRIIR